MTIPSTARAASVVVAFALLGVACDGASFQGDIAPCRCDVEQCTSASCGYEFRLDAGCDGQLSTAEVLIDDHLEAEALVPGSAMFPCSRTEPGVEAQIIIRGGNWVWGPLRERCLQPGETRLLVLQCIEAGS